MVGHFAIRRRLATQACHVAAWARAAGADRLWRGAITDATSLLAGNMQATLQVPRMWEATLRRAANDGRG